jgi:hypothetical protein
MEGGCRSAIIRLEHQGEVGKVITSGISLDAEQLFETGGLLGATSGLGKAMEKTFGKIP